MPPTSSPARAQAAQQFLPIEAIRDGTIILRSGQGLRAVLMVSSLNFALKSEEEQDALVFQYESFLNALDFPLQFVVQSRRLNIKPYLELLAAREKEETGELLKVQIAEYAEFVKTFVELTNIVAKTFLAVVPFTPSVAARRRGILAAITGLFGGPTAPAAGNGDTEFAQFKNQLAQRVDAVASGLKRLGLRVAELGTEELVELFYGLYNPSESERVHRAAAAENQSAQI